MHMKLLHLFQGRALFIDDHKTKHRSRLVPKDDMGARMTWEQDRSQERANRAIAPPEIFCKHDGIHVVHTKRYFSGLRYLYVNFFSRQLFRIRLCCFI